MADDDIGPQPERPSEQPPLSDIRAYGVWMEKHRTWNDWRKKLRIKVMTALHAKFAKNEGSPEDVQQALGILLAIELEGPDDPIGMPGRAFGL